VGLITLACREAHARKQRYQYCWFCRTTEEGQRSSSILLHKHWKTTSEENLSPLGKSRGRQVWTAEQSGHRKRFTNSASTNPSKYLVTNPWPHKRLPIQDGHLSGRGQEYAFPKVNISFTITEQCSIKKPLWGRVIKVGELDNSAVITLFLLSQINTISSTHYTKHHDKKIPLADSLLRRVTEGRAVNGQYPKLLPSPIWKMIVEEGDQRLAQFNKRLVTKFPSGLGESALGDISLGDILPMDSLEEIIQLILDGTFDEIGEEKDHVVEWQEPLADEISRRSSVPFQKRWGEDNFFKKFDKIGTNFQKQVPCQLRTSFQYYPT